MMSPVPITRDLILLGGGHTHALVLRKWAMQPLPGVQVTLVNPGVKAPYTGMLPGFVAGHYERQDLDIDLVRLVRAAGARLIVDRAIGIDSVARTVQLADRPAIPYDVLSIDVGISSHIPEPVPAIPPILPAKPLGPFADAWSALVERVEREKFAASIAVIGAGVAGVELALAIAYRLRSLGRPAARIQLIEATDEPMREINRTARRELIAELDQADVSLLTNSGLEKIDANADFVISAAGASPHAWLTDTSLALEDGYIVVDEHLQSVNTPDVFAAGDCAHLSHAPRPKAGVFAVRQAPVLFQNLRAALSTGDRRAYRPQRDYLKLISTGRRSAITDKWGIGLSGPWMWTWKDRIDRAFMKQFIDPVEMPRPKLPEHVARGVEPLFEAHQKACGACGAKISHSALTNGLNAAGDGASPLSLEDAAIVETATGFEVFTTDHLRAFNADPFMLAKVAAIHALGDIWAMGAAPKTVLANIILPPLAPDKQSAMLAEIMHGANTVFNTCGVSITGGHTSSGAELTIGYSIVGATPTHPITQSGAQVGDILVLTKPIGTGILLAAEMQQCVDGDDYRSALISMCRLQDKAAQQLARVASAMTDVTGFGLAGHLLNILDASGVSANLDLDRVPILPGAARLSERGIRSTLYPANAAQHARIEGDNDHRVDLLFDPQTCGGLLACIPSEAWFACRAAFDSADEPIWKIGSITDGPPLIRLTSA
ncbi:MAG: selenide, water dikinase SelD [Pseudomonadota bacterium]